MHGKQRIGAGPQWKKMNGRRDLSWMPVRKWSPTSGTSQLCCDNFVDHFVIIRLSLFFNNYQLLEHLVHKSRRLLFQPALNDILGSNLSAHHPSQILSQFSQMVIQMLGPICLKDGEDGGMLTLMASLLHVKWSSIQTNQLYY